jgi:hypothetical protein
LGGKNITAGPFSRGKWVGCVVDRRRLVWFDPGKDQPLWGYGTPRNDELVGQPHLVGDVLLVADATGRFVGLDPETGKERGPGYELQAAVAPATAPVAFGKDRAFVPLTDGTVLLLPMRHFRAP